jgi:serine/threonine-protein kinase
LLAYELFRDPHFLDLAVRSGRDAWSQETPAWDLCCGAAGRAYALLALWRQTGDRQWLTRARRLALRAVARARQAPLDRGLGPREGLMRGLGAVAMLMEELLVPEQARMPFVEREAWPLKRVVAEGAHV